MKNLLTLKRGIAPSISLNILFRNPSALAIWTCSYIERVKKKKILLNSRRKSSRFLLGKHFKLTIKTKLLLYKTLLTSIQYDILPQSVIKKSNSNKIQTFHSITLRIITNAPSYVSNHTLHTELKTNTIEETAKIMVKRFHSRLKNHQNSLVSALGSDSIPGNPPRKQKRNQGRDLNF